MAINKNDYLDGDGNYDLKKDLVDELIDEVNDTSLNVQTSSLNSNDRTGWTNQSSGLYYMGGTELGYPTNYGVVFHIHTGGTLIMQIFIARGQFAYRAFNQSQTMDWNVIS